MKQPPLLLTLFAVMVLAIVNLELKGSAEIPGKEFMTFAAAAVCIGLLHPLMQQRVDEEEEPVKPAVNDDLDLSA